jgi:hypothetical protein
MSIRPALTLLLGWLAGCSPLVRQPAPLRGAATDIRQLAGTWEGEFRSAAGNRVGLIFFDLKAGGDTAFGSVTLDRVIPTATCVDMTRPEETVTIVAPIVLRFGAIGVSRGSIGGWLQPYRDPDLACWMDTWFEGHLLRDTLRGSYFARRTDTDTVRAGTWWAART